MAKIKDINEFTPAENKFIEASDMKKTSKPQGRGRPKKEKLANQQIYINLTEDEKKVAEDKAAEFGISLSALAKIGLKKILEL